MICDCWDRQSVTENSESEFSERRNRLDQLNFQEATTHFERSLCPETDVWLLDSTWDSTKMKEIDKTDWAMTPDCWNRHSVTESLDMETYSDEINIDELATESSEKAK
jgi:hypothetical protein